MCQKEVNMKDEEIIELFFEVNRLNLQWGKRQVKSLSPFRGQYRALSALEQTGAIPQKELARILEVRPASISEILLKLEHKGLVERIPDQKDKRITLVTLTNAGRMQAAKNRRERAKFHSSMLSDLTEEEKESFVRILKKIRHYYYALPDMEGEKRSGRF